MIEDYKVRLDGNRIVLEVTLKLLEEGKKECFTSYDALNLLIKDGFKPGVLLNYVLLSNVSERKRKGEFIFLFQKEEVLEGPILFQPKVSKRKSKKEE